MKDEFPWKVWLHFLMFCLGMALASPVSAAIISGTVSNNTGVTGSRIYLSVAPGSDGSSGGATGLGVSIPSPGPHASANYAIRGVPDGFYVVHAFLDSRNSTSASRHSSDPSGDSYGVAITGGKDATYVNLNLYPSYGAAPLQPPAIKGVVPGHGAALVNWSTPKDSSGNELAYSYNVYWSTDSGFSNNAGSYRNSAIGKSQKSIPAHGDGGAMYVQTALDSSTPLADGTQLWYVVEAQRGQPGDANYQVAPSEVYGPVTIGALPSDETSAFDVKGTVSIDSGIGISPGAPLYLALSNGGAGLRIAKIDNPGASNPFTISGVSNGDYQFYAILDQNQDGTIWAGDYQLPKNQTPIISVHGADVPNVAVTVPKLDVEAAVTTSHLKDAVGGESYALNFNIGQGFQLPVNASIHTGKDLAGPVDLAVTSDGGLSFQVNNAARPSKPSDPDGPQSYSVDLGYADGSTATTTLTVSDVLDTFADPATPKGALASFNATPVLQWGAPSPFPAGGFSYTLDLSTNGFASSYLTSANLWWNSDTISSSQSGATFNFDGSASQGALSDLTSYLWDVAVNDTKGNKAVKQANFYFGGGVSGKVTDAVDGASGIGGVVVQVWTDYGSSTGYRTTTAPDGTYNVGGFQGRYRVCFDPDNSYVGKCYPNAQDVTGATSVNVSYGQVTPDINVSLIKAGSIHGTVSSASGPVPGVNVGLFNSYGQPASNSAVSDASGNYTMSGIAPGSYKINFNASSTGAYGSQWYSGKTDSGSADPVTVSSGQSTTANATLVLGGAVSGQLTSDGSTGIQGVTVQLIDASGNYVPIFTYTDAGGSYALHGINPGSYKLFFDASSAGYVSQWYNGKADSASADAFGVVSGGSLTASAVLTLGTSVSGTVTDLSSGSPIMGIMAQLYQPNSTGGYNSITATTDSSGGYSFNGVGAGTYKVCFAANYTTYVPKCYDNLSYDVLHATTVTVAAPPETSTGINAALVLGGNINGQVTDGTNGIAQFTVMLYDAASGTLVSSNPVSSSNNGNYALSGIPAGSYQLFFSSNGGFVGRWYDGYSGSTAQASAATVTLNPGDYSGGIGVTLAKGMSLSGTVSNGSQPLPNIPVTLEDSSGNAVTIPNSGPSSASTDANGHYTLSVPSAGDYLIYFGGGAGYSAKWYAQGSASATLADAGSVHANDGDSLTGFDIVLTQGGSISGKLTDAGNAGAPVAGIQVTVFSNSTGLINATSNGSGNYTVTGLADASYSVCFYSGSTSYLPQCYGSNGSDPNGGTPVTISGANSVGGANAALTLGATINGTVTHNGAGVPNVQAQLRDQNGDPVFGMAPQTDASGKYSIRAVAGGSNYFVYFATGNGNSYAPQWYNNAVTMAQATAIAGLQNGDIRNDVNAALALGGTITGKLLDDSGHPVSFYGIQLNDGSGTPVSSTNSNQDGSYIFTMLPAGSYKIQFPGSGYLPQWYNNAARFEEADAITVTAGVTSNLNDTVISAKQLCSTALSSSAASVSYGTSVTFSATVTPLSFDGSSQAPPTGTVSFLVDGEQAGSANLTNGSAGFTTTLAGGNHQVTAQYQGNGTYRMASSGSFSQTVTKVDQTITFGTLGDLAYGAGAFTLSAQSSAADLPVSFSIVSGPATLNGNTLTITGAGAVLVLASQAGDSNYNAAPGVQRSFKVTKGSATVTLASLQQSYDAGAKAATATTTPGGLNLSFSYNGSATPPVAAGSYQVVATVNDPNYQGSASGTLVIASAPATVTLGALSQVYDGSPRAVTASTTPSGLNLSFSYNGSPTPPVAAGSYQVLATVNDPDYQGSASGTLVIAKATATVTLGALTPLYDAGAKAAAASTTPSGLNLTVTYNGSATPPVAAGSYQVLATVNDANYQGSASGTLVIGKASATLSIDPATLTQSYDGSARVVRATVLPAGLTGMAIGYAGSATAPSGAGNYAVTVTLDNPNYQAASATGTLKVAKATATLSWSNPSAIGYGTALGATQLAAASGTRGSFSYSPPSGTLLNAGSQTLTVSFVPADSANYDATPVTASVTLAVQKAVPGIVWNTPADMPYGTPLGSSQLNATSTVPGSFAYSQSAGTVLVPGSQSVTATFTPTDTVNYEAAARPVTLTVITPDGDLNGDGKVDVSDALLVLRIAVGVVPMNSAYLAHGIVAPGADGAAHPKLQIDIRDAIFILRKAVGLPNNG